jgi:hypothetical protein
MELQINNIEGNSFATASNVYDLYKQSGDKNDFELVLDGLMLERYSDNEDIKNYIKSLPKENKRLATLSLLSDDNVLWSQINELVKKEQSSYDRLKGIYNIIKDYVKIADVERKKHGEILTPFKELAEPMVKLIEKYDAEFWKNKNHKVLDSSAGYGTFLILAAYKFMVGLRDEIEDEEERFKWIVENCLYYGELQAKSVFSWLVAIDPHNEYKTNIYWGSFLTKEFDEHAKNVWGVEKWNLIIQNPPYQMNTGNVGSGHTLWDKFVLKSLNILSKGGYMIMVHPSGWRNISGSFESVKNEIFKRNLLYLEIHDINDGIKMFDASTRYDFYCLKNSSDYTQTEIVDENGDFNKIDISNFKFIPNSYFNEFIKILNHNSEKVSICFSHSMYDPRKSWMSESADDDFKYPCVKYISKINANIDFRYSREKKGMFGIPKVMFGIGAQVGGIEIDKFGNYGLCQFVAGISDVSENLESIKKALKSEKFKKLMKACQFTTQMYNYKIIQEFKKDFWKEFI